MPETYISVDQDGHNDIGTNPMSVKKPLSKKSSVGRHGRPCEHCGHFPTHADTAPIAIYPPPRPIDHIRPDGRSFIGYVVLIAVVIFLLFAACKYLP